MVNQYVVPLGFEILFINLNIYFIDLFSCLEVIWTVLTFSCNIIVQLWCVGIRFSMTLILEKFSS